MWQTISLTQRNTAKLAIIRIFCLCRADFISHGNKWKLWLFSNEAFRFCRRSKNQHKMWLYGFVDLRFWFNLFFTTFCVLHSFSQPLFYYRNISTAGAMGNLADLFIVMVWCIWKSRMTKAAINCHHWYCQVPLPSAPAIRVSIELTSRPMIALLKGSLHHLQQVCGRFWRQ